nr:MAG TPA: hypothetical protein [Caudoviricetes sp.]
MIRLIRSKAETSCAHCQTNTGRDCIFAFLAI